MRKDLSCNDKQNLVDTATTMGEGHGAGRRGRENEQFEVPGIGHELGPVKLMKEVGRGAMGVVFVGYHRLLGRSVAVKFLRFTADHEPSGATGDSPVSAGAGSGSWDRFFGEARAAAAVRHPNLAEVYHADLAPGRGTPYIVFEYVDGPTLGQVLQHAGRFDCAVTLTILSDIASALAELHDRGVIHRDVKPSNVLVEATGRVVVTDFGLAVRRVSPTALAQDEETAGTPGYMAPEIFDGRASTRSDVYALAILAHQLLTGKLPFEGTIAEVREKHTAAPFPTDALRSCGATDELVEVLERAAHKQVVFRHKTARELVRALSKLQRPADVVATTRAELAKLVASMRGGAAPASSASPSSNPGSSTTPPVAGPSSGEVLSPQYTETLARHAAVKRERLAASSVPEWMRPAGPPRQIPTASFAPGTAPPTVNLFARDFSAEYASPPPRSRRLLFTLAIVAGVVVLCTIVGAAAWVITK